MFIYLLAAAPRGNLLDILFISLIGSLAENLGRLLHWHQLNFEVFFTLQRRNTF